MCFNEAFLYKHTFVCASNPYEKVAQLSMAKWTVRNGLYPNKSNHTQLDYLYIQSFFARRLLNFACLWLSRAYIKPPPKTTAAPSITPGPNLFPNNHMLSNRLTSFRILSTMVTVKALAMEPRMLTPRIHTYCVIAFKIKKTTCLGTHSRIALTGGAR